MNTIQSLHPLLVHSKVPMSKWALKEYPHEVVGAARGFEVRIYNFPAEGFLPYFIVEIALDDGWIMQTHGAVTETAARESAQEILKSIGTNVIQLQRTAEKSS